MAMTPAYPGADSMGAAPTDAPSAAPEGDGSYTIEISCKSDGTFMVNVEDGATESAEESGAQDPEEMGEGADTDGEGRACKTIKEALTLALEIHRADGKMPGGADDDFQSGFGAQA